MDSGMAMHVQVIWRGSTRQAVNLILHWRLTRDRIELFVGLRDYFDETKLRAETIRLPPRYH